MLYALGIATSAGAAGTVMMQFFNLHKLNKELKSKKEVLFGGLIIKDGNYFKINEDEIYQSFGKSIEMREKAKPYKAGKIKVQEGWKFFEVN